jgi:hypothetical protein
LNFSRNIDHLSIISSPVSAANARINILSPFPNVRR